MSCLLPFFHNSPDSFSHRGSYFQQELVHGDCSCLRSSRVVGWCRPADIYLVRFFLLVCCTCLPFLSVLGQEMMKSEEDVLWPCCAFSYYNFSSACRSFSCYVCFFSACRIFVFLSCFSFDVLLAVFSHFPITFCTVVFFCFFCCSFSGCFCLISCVLGFYVLSCCPSL